MIGIELPLRRARADEPVPAGAQFNAFIHVATDDTVTFTLPAVEMGQGVYTSQTQCLAEELDVALDRVIAAHAPGRPGQLRKSGLHRPGDRRLDDDHGLDGAAAKGRGGSRVMLVQAAAAQWGVDTAA